jgi:hypothetical protein
MKSPLLATALALALATVLTASSAYAQTGGNRMKACADEWNTMKAAKQTEGKKYRDFQKECLARTTDTATPAATPAAATPAATTTTTPAAKTTAKPAATTTTTTTPAATTAAKPSTGRQAMVARERACGVDWKADKAAGKVAAGMTWPKYWSDCDKRKKAEGM